ncbi:uncharacterized protein LOC129609577 [Condylostylus longicornis]|uniref:uncharacterized protein LOC129609577 n=1 Tax=Condylostylus longicornis TaxID=2530218 RepID=UPI00244E5659|nr:uncharacterized protein LOC129609577 [Condylostylus longicornis]
MSTSEQQLRYITDNFLNHIGEKLLDEKIIGHEISHSGGFDGFMSTIFELDIKTVNEKTKKEKIHKLIAKFMKSTVSFRKASKSYEQFSNEIFIYGKVLPYYEEVLKKQMIKKNLIIDIKNWIPRTFYAEYGLIQGLSDGRTNESVLVLENLKPLGYRGGPRCFLDRQHLLLSVKILAEYHAFSYVMRINKDPKLQEFIEEIIPLPFIIQQNATQSTLDNSLVQQQENNKNQDQTIRKRKLSCDALDANNDDDENENDENKNKKYYNTVTKTENNFYDVLYRVAFDRFFMFIEKLKIINSNMQISTNIENQNKNLLNFIKEKNINDEFFETLDAFKLKWYDKPTALLEYIRCNCVDNSENDVFPVILHGDFNRNNLMYQYNEHQGYENPIGVKMIDFQELRYGTPAIDLAFHMYMNMEPSIRNEFWMELLKFYHNTVINTMANILNVEIGHELLNPYRFEKFNEHFTKYAFYGALVCMHFLPWMTCSEEEVEKLSHHFATDMHGNDFRQISIDAGGEESDKLIAEIVQHAIKLGYMKNLL